MTMAAESRPICFRRRSPPILRRRGTGWALVSRWRKRSSVLTAGALSSRTDQRGGPQFKSFFRCFIPREQVAMAKILIIDDEAVFARSAAHFLSRSGHECWSLASAEEGLSSVETERPDLVLLDIKLAGMSGLEALKRIAGLDPNAIVIIMTAYSSVESAVAAMKDGAYDYIQKPIDHDELKFTIEKALETSRLRERPSHFQRKEVQQSAPCDIVGTS